MTAYFAELVLVTRISRLYLLGQALGAFFSSPMRADYKCYVV